MLDGVHGKLVFEDEDAHLPQIERVVVLCGGFRHKEQRTNPFGHPAQVCLAVLIQIICNIRMELALVCKVLVQTDLYGLCIESQLDLGLSQFCSWS